MQGITPSAPFLPTDKTKMDSTTYTVSGIDGSLNALTREGGKFQVQPWPRVFGQAMQLLVAPGHFYNGTTLTEKGARTTGNFTSGSASVTSVADTTGIEVGMACLAYTFTSITFTGNITNGSASMTSVSPTTNIYIGMPIYGAGIQPGTVVSNLVSTTITMSLTAQATTTGVTVIAVGMSPVSALGSIVTNIAGSTITLSQNAGATVAGAFAVFCQPIGTITTGTTANTSNIITAIPSTAGIFAGMAITGTGVPAATTISAVLSASSVQISNAATASATVALTISIPAPASNSRVDYISLLRTTGVASWTSGVSGVTPATPALPANTVPDALLLTTSATTSLAAANLSDVRDLAALGMAAGAFSPIDALAKPLLGMVLGLGF